MFDAKPLIQKLLQRQESLSMTQKDFAQLLGVSSPVVSKWRKGQGNYNPTLEQIGAVADRLGTTVVELLTPDTEPAQTTPAPSKKTAKTSTVRGKKVDAKEDKTQKAAAKTSAAKSTRSTKAKKVDAPAETAKKGRKTAVKAAKASVSSTATADTEKTTPKKRGRPKKVS